MSNKYAICRSLQVKREHVGAYSGGKVQLSKDDKTLVCSYGSDVTFLDIQTGLVTGNLKSMNKVVESSEELSAFALHPKGEHIVTSSKNLQLRLWSVSKKACIRSWKSNHKTPVLCMEYDGSGTLVATGGSDRVIQIWDVEKGYCTHYLRGHTKIVTLVRFHPNPHNLVLYSCSQDCTVKVWDLVDSENNHCKCTLTGHTAQVTSISFSKDGWTMVTGGRDNVVNIWNARNHALLKTVPTFESVEGLAVIHPVKDTQDSDNIIKIHESLEFVTVGDKGIIRLWRYGKKSNYKSKVCEVIRKHENTEKAGLSKIIVRQSGKEAIVVTGDQSFQFIDLSSEELCLKRHIMGFNDEILCVKYIAEKSRAQNTNLTSSSTLRLAMATNSEKVRIINPVTFDTTLLTGHSAIILSLDVSPCFQYLATASKDKTARIWNITDQDNTYCVGRCVGHTEGIGSIAFPRKEKSFSVNQHFFLQGVQINL